MCGAAILCVRALSCACFCPRGPWGGTWHAGMYGLAAQAASARELHVGAHDGRCSPPIYQSPENACARSADMTCQPARPNTPRERTLRGAGVDLCGPVGTPVHACADGDVFCFDFCPEKYDWGHILILRHRVGAREVWSLYGHLSAASLAGKVVGQAVRRGEVLGWMGPHAENGGWFPHTHFQLMLLEPVIADCPGVVAYQDRQAALLV
jgi:hypothetical protein